MGRKHTDEEKTKISQGLKGKPKSLKHREALSIVQKGRHYSPATEFKKGQCSTFRGKHHTKETRLKLSQLHKGKHNSPSTEFTSERVTDPEFHKRKMRALRKVMNRPEYKEKRREISARLCQDPTYIAKISHSEEMREYLSQLAQERVKDPEYVRKILSSRRPTDIEQTIMDVVEKYNLPYKYTGNGTFQVGSSGKYPDFVNVNGEKIAIDVFGDRWHNLEEIPERKAIFAEYGWKLIIIWGHEIKELSEAEILAELRRR